MFEYVKWDTKKYIFLFVVVFFPQFSTWFQCMFNKAYRIFQSSCKNWVMRAFVTHIQCTNVESILIRQLESINICIRKCLFELSFRFILLLVCLFDFLSFRNLLLSYAWKDFSMDFCLRTLVNRYEFENDSHRKYAMEVRVKERLFELKLCVLSVSWIDWGQAKSILFVYTLFLFSFYPMT